MPSPIRRMTLRAPDPLMALRMVSVWLAPSRAAPPLADRSPFAARLRGSPIDSFLSLPHPASTRTATATTTQAALDMEFIGMDAPSCELAVRIERHPGERKLAGREIDQRDYLASTPIPPRRGEQVQSLEP